MNIHMQHQARTVDCRSCGDSIGIGMPAVRQSYLTFDGKSRMRFHHFECFMAYMARWYIENPFVPTPRGVKGKTIPEGVKQERANIIASYSYTMKRKRKLIADGEFEAAEALDDRFERLKIKIEGVGGVPKSWV